MKFKILLLFLLFCTVVSKAQQPYRNLIFSEVRMDQHHHSYVELCNMGNVAVDLAQFDVGSVSPWSYAPWDTVNTFSRAADNFVTLPARMLNPGETFVIATVREWANEQHLINPDKYGISNTKSDTWRLADMLLHVSESPGGLDPTDSVSVGSNALSVWGGTYCFYLCHHFAEGDSAITDAANGVFTGTNGQRPGNYGPSDVAGVPDATTNSILVRKHTVTSGSIDWEKTRGVDITDSEWLPVPILIAGGFESGRKEFWTMGNHGNYRLNAQSLKSKTIAIDWNNKTMKADWGARNQDSIMNEFDFAPGISWKYHVSPSKIDSAFTSVRTGDSLTLYACGNQLDIIKFGLISLAPLASENRVISKNAKNGATWYTPFVVSENNPVMDTISTVPFATRVDTLFKYLEKPAAASWKIIWKDGTERPDLIRGDILRVTAANGTAVKDYYVKVTKYMPSHNANLASITWPDIPEFYKGIYGWVGDTIPQFSPTKLNYTVQVPFETKGIPSLVAKAQDSDTKIEVVRATSLFGTDAAKTVKFYTTAEDDTTLLTYSVRLEKEKDLSNVQPYSAEPFFSQFVFRTDYRQTFIEICNPGNQPLDLSRYVIVRSNNMNTAQAITTTSTDTDWANRFRRYVPGYVWQDEASWQVQPGVLEQDLGVNPIVEGGDVFVIAWAFPNYKDASAVLFPGVPDQIDVNFKNGYNPWGIELGEDAGGLANYSSITGGWFNDDWILYKILNDSVLNGTKPLIDPYDVQVVDVIGRCNGQSPGLMIESPVTNFDQNSGMKRLPEYYKGNPEAGGSFLDTLNNKPSEWFYTNEAYWSAKGAPWPGIRAMSADGIGSHEFNPVTEFISTVSSASYTVSKGYTMNETIGGGVQAGITVAEFMTHLITIEGQTITLTSNGTTITDGSVLKNGDKIKVISSNGENTTQYTISVTSKGLDNNALLTSSVYTIKTTGATGTIAGFKSGTTLREVFDNVEAPTNASLFGMYNESGTYAPFVQMKFDTTYVEVIATDKIFFEVVAQDGVTRIDYKLMPNSLPTDAYVLSNVYDIDQNEGLIKLLPDGTNVNSFFDNLSPAPGATIELINKFGQVREMGTIYEDDKLVVTAADGVTIKIYSLELFSIFAGRYKADLYSEIYTVTQKTSKIAGVIKGTTVADFVLGISVSFGATYELYDAKGILKTTTIMENGDQIFVTSENGIVIRKYKITVSTNSVLEISSKNILAYPNPTTGLVNIVGMDNGNTIRVFNVLGNSVLTINANSIKETISLQDQPNGLYIINVTNGTKQVAKLKIIKK